MMKNISQFKCIVDTKEFVFFCDPDSNTHQAKLALFEFIKYLGKIEDASIPKSEEQIKEEEPKVEEINPEV